MNSAVPRFGPAGLSESYKAAGYKSSLEAVKHSVSFGLNAFEYQCGRGVRLPGHIAAPLAAEAQEAGLQFSLHAPYYISMASPEEEKRTASLRYIRESAAAVKSLGGRRVILHSGGVGKMSREEALALAKGTLARMRGMLDAEGHEDVLLCPETMGRVGQLGSLEEVLELCRADARHIPCLDFGHLNARDGGSIKTKADYAAILDKLAEALPDERAAAFHVHFSKIEYSKGGEVRHLTFEDEVYGPPYEPFLELCFERGLSPTVICESAGTQAEDAHTMQKYYISLTWV